MKKAAKKPISPRSTRVETANFVLPSHTNHMGTMFGGVLMQWIDIAAGIAATRHAHGLAVTASMDRLHFLRPIRVEEIVVVKAEVTCTGRTSMEVTAEAWAENPWSRKRELATRAHLTFVAVDEAGRPREVPALRPVTVAEKQRHKEAKRRRAARLRETDKPL
jgi:acyl-CoA hydrolase